MGVNIVLKRFTHLYSYLHLHTAHVLADLFYLEQTTNTMSPTTALSLLASCASHQLIQHALHAAPTSTAAAAARAQKGGSDTTEDDDDDDRSLQSDFASDDDMPSWTMLPPATAAAPKDAPSPHSPTSVLNNLSLSPPPMPSPCSPAATAAAVTVVKSCLPTVKKHRAPRRVTFADDKVGAPNQHRRDDSGPFHLAARRGLSTSESELRYKLTMCLRPVNKFEWIAQSRTYARIRSGNDRTPSVRELQDAGFVLPAMAICPPVCLDRCQILFAIEFWESIAIPPLFIRLMIDTPFQQWPQRDRVLFFAMWEKHYRLFRGGVQLFAYSTTGFILAVNEIQRIRYGTSVSPVCDEAIPPEHREMLFIHALTAAAVRYRRVDMLLHARRLGAVFDSSLLMYACHGGHADIIHTIRKQGPVTIEADHVCTLAAHGHMVALTQLIPLLKQDARIMSSALAAAVKHQQHRVVSMLLTNAAPLSSFVLDDEIRAEHWAMVKLLMGAGGVPTSAIAVHLARKGLADMLRTVLAIPAVAADHATLQQAALAASANGHTDCVEQIVLLGVPVDTRECMFRWMCHVMNHQGQGLQATNTATNRPIATAAP